MLVAPLLAPLRLHLRQMKLVCLEAGLETSDGVLFTSLNLARWLPEALGNRSPGSLNLLAHFRAHTGAHVRSRRNEGTRMLRPWNVQVACKIAVIAVLLGGLPFLQAQGQR